MSSSENIGVACTDSFLGWPSNLRRVAREAIKDPAPGIHPPAQMQKFFLSQSPLDVSLDAADGHLHTGVKISL